MITTVLYLFGVYPCMKWPPNEVHKPVGGCGYTKWMHPAVLHDYNSSESKDVSNCWPSSQENYNRYSLCYRLQCIPVNAELQKPMPDPKMFSLHSRQSVCVRPSRLCQASHAGCLQPFALHRMNDCPPTVRNFYNNKIIYSGWRQLPLSEESKTKV